MTPEATRTAVRPNPCCFLPPASPPWSRTSGRRLDELEQRMHFVGLALARRRHQ